MNGDVHESEFARFCSEKLRLEPENRDVDALTAYVEQLPIDEYGRGNVFEHLAATVSD